MKYEVLFSAIRKTSRPYASHSKSLDIGSRSHDDASYFHPYQAERTHRKEGTRAHAQPLRTFFEKGGKIQNLGPHIRNQYLLFI